LDNAFLGDPASLREGLKMLCHCKPLSSYEYNESNLKESSS